MMRVNEIFTSLQGEGFHTGTVATFIRFSGCNLRCSFCDTDFAHGTEMTEDEIADQVEMGSFVVLTGGEPSLQVTERLITLLHDKGCYVAIETNGTHPLPDGLDWITCSPKAVSTRSSTFNVQPSTFILGSADEVKVVYTATSTDDEQASREVELWREKIKARHYFLQPCERNGESNIVDTVAYILDHPWWRLSLQTHKLIHIR